VASDREHRATGLHRQQWSYTRIAEHLGDPDRQAAHRGVLRALAAVPAAEAAMLRSMRLHKTDERLRDLQCRLWDLMERHRPHPEATAADRRLYFRIFDALFRVLDTRCRLRGLYVQPWRYDRWWRRDVPAAVWVPLQHRVDQLGREARIPLRWRSPQATQPVLAPVVPLHPAPAPLVDVDTLVSPAVRRLLETG
jgi:hypothetical protein